MPQLQKSKITPFLWFDADAEPAAKLYTSIFENSRILDTSRAGDRVMSVTFELDGQRLMALNGGPHYKLSPAFSLFVSVESQEDWTAPGTRCWQAAASPPSAAGSRTATACPGRSSPRR